MATTPEWILVTLKVIDVLEALGITYTVCGSVASITHGVARATVDTDLLADFKLEHSEAFAAALKEEFYIDPDSMREAIRQRTSFNAIHQDTMFKVDIFITKARLFDQEQLARRVQKIIARNPDRKAWISSAENSVLSKLEWFRLGDEVSERQWRDVLGILKTQRGRLDIEYMRKTASILGIHDLLASALEEAEK